MDIPDPFVWMPPGLKSFSPSPGLQKKNTVFGADVRRGRPRPEGFSKNFVEKKFELMFLAPKFKIGS